MTLSDSSAIRVSGLKKSFGRKQALDGIQFSVPRGAVAGFLGPNGAGKTTTLRLLLGLAFPDSGDMELLGTPMPQNRCGVLEQIGTLVEKPSFIDALTGYENLWWFGHLNKPVTEERLNEVLGRVGLSDSAHRLFGVYSTGMKQRLGVAAAILHQPSLLILDEPTNGMDPQGRAQMRDIIKEIHAREGATIFLSSHLLDEIQRLCDYVVIVDHGKTKAEGRVAELLSHEQETWEIRLPPPEIGTAREFLEKHPLVNSVKQIPRGLEVALKPDSSSEVNRELVQKGLHVQAFIPREASLEDTFLSLTDGAAT